MYKYQYRNIIINIMFGNTMIRKLTIFPGSICPRRGPALRSRSLGPLGSRLIQLLKRALSYQRIFFFGEKGRGQKIPCSGPGRCCRSSWPCDSPWPPTHHLPGNDLKHKARFGPCRFGAHCASARPSGRPEPKPDPKGA